MSKDRCNKADNFTAAVVGNVMNTALNDMEMDLVDAPAGADVAGPVFAPQAALAGASGYTAPGPNDVVSQLWTLPF